MPTYDYRCTITGQVFEARHGINDKLHSWGELCASIGMEIGSTAPDSPIERLATGGTVVNSRSLKNPDLPPCASGGGCGGGGMCGL